MKSTIFHIGQVMSVSFLPLGTCSNRSGAAIIGGMSPNTAYNADRQDVPHNMRQIRKARGMSLEVLAEQLGVETTTVQRYETQAQRLRVNQLSDIARILRCSVVELVDDGSLEGMRTLSDQERDVLSILDQMGPTERERAIAVLRTLAAPQAAQKNK